MGYGGMSFSKCERFHGVLRGRGPNNDSIGNVDVPIRESGLASAMVSFSHFQTWVDNWRETSFTV